MIQRSTVRRSILVVCAALALACAARTTPYSEYGYSSWGSRAGINSKGEFERARSECLTQHHIDDPASVEPDSALEKRFAKCMRVKGWCTNSGSCQ
jgi:hypothetical protein